MLFATQIRALAHVKQVFELIFFSAGCSDGRVRRTGGHQVDYEAVRPHQQLVHLQHNDNGIFEPENWLSILKRSCLCIEKTHVHFDRYFSGTILFNF
jgi:hypothetical protein